MVPERLEEGSEPPEPGSDDTGERGTTKSRQPSGSGVDPFSPAGIAMRELMKTQSVERSAWSRRTAWFVLAVLAGALLAVILSTIH